MKRNVLIISAVLLLIILAALFMYNKPHRSVRKADAAYRISVADLVTTFQDDELKANSAYLDKILEVRGTLKEIMFNDSSLVLVLGENGLASGISCYMAEDQNNDYQRLRRGDTVTVKGICHGMLFDVVLDKCLLVQKK